MTRQDELAQDAKRRSTLKSIKVKKESRIKQIKAKAEEDIREINILYAEDPERLRAKYAADEYARSEKAKVRAAKRIEAEKRILAQESKQRRYTLAEEIFTSIVQGLGAIAAIVATVLLVVQAVKYSPASLRAWFIPSYACVGASLVIMYIMSTLHHALVPVTAKEVFDRLSHAFAFVAIACGYTAIALTALNGTVNGWILFGIVWATAVLGISLYSVFGRRIEKLIMVIYVVLGWIGVIIFRQLYDLMPPVSFRMLITSGIIYTIGIPFYLNRKIKYMHSVGSLIMLVASVCLYLSLLFQLFQF